MSKNIRTIYLLGLSCLYSGVAFAQNETKPDIASEPLVTDRPDATESPTTITPGFVQVETGAFYESFEDNSIKFETYTYNTTLVRLGLLDNLEFRVGWDFVEGRTSVNGNRLNDVASGFNPLLLGTKIAISEEKGWRPEIGVLGHIYLPFTAGEDYRPETTGVDFIFSFAHTLSEKSSLGYNLGARWQDDSPEAAYLYSLSYGYSISDTLGTYLEVYGNLPEDSKSNHLWNTGLTYLISNNVQLDATIGTSITEGQDLLLSAGVSFRLPTK
ncbi:transporter [uncultured Psychroserpens sp.]|uniref:transporter n=1 Tax=uncultured Psychroserpens sp. TaxID=255436 RepID=UPI002628DEB9|nr:transporter [uncultured Psychroserpens sp.]